MLRTLFPDKPSLAFISEKTYCGDCGYKNSTERNKKMKNFKVDRNRSLRRYDDVGLEIYTLNFSIRCAQKCIKIR